MKIYKNVESGVKPKELDNISSPDTIYVNTDIQLVEIDTGMKNDDGTPIKNEIYRYTSTVYSKEEWYQLQINKVTGDLYPSIDKDDCTLEEAIGFMHTSLSTACNQKIVKGIKVNTTQGIESFSLTMADQNNIKKLVDNIMMLKLDSVFYHADGKICRDYNNLEFLMISFIVDIYILEETTYCNQLLQYLKTLSNKETVFSLQYGMTLPDYYDNQVKGIVATQTAKTIKAFNTAFSCNFTLEQIEKARVHE